MREIKVRQIWASNEEPLGYDRFVFVVSISGDSVIVLNVDTLRKSTLKKKTLTNRFLYSGMVRRSKFESLLKIKGE